MPPGYPSIAALAGGFWGGCLYLFCTAGPTPAVEAIAPAVDGTVFAIGPSAWLLVLLIVIPAVYVGLAARRGRRGTGILPVSSATSLLTLALGWTLVEVVVGLGNPSGPHEGLLTGSQAEGPHLHWLARLLGYVCTALVVACVNASLVGFLSGARLRFPTYRSLVGSPNVVGRLASQTFLAIQSWTLRQAHPRAPPIDVALAS